MNPQKDRHVELILDGALAGDSAGKVLFVGSWDRWTRLNPGNDQPVEQAKGLIIPPMLDAHIHVPQWPIRGRFCQGVDAEAHGRLIAGLNRNVFPEEARQADEQHARQVIDQFRQDTLAQGVIGGAAYMTVHASATRLALQNLGEHWSVGMVLMNQNCPEYLRTDETNLERDIRQLAAEFGPRFIVTDRFAVSVNSELRQRAAELARQLNLRTQTHLNEQRGEKKFVEKELYPHADSYARVYKQDGLFEQPCLCAHCIWMRAVEWAIMRDCGCAVAHCPSSNALLGSGIMDLDQVKKHGLDWSICTDVGGGPSTSLLAEMGAFLRVHQGRHLTSAQEALWGVTLGAARVLNLDRHMGNFEPGKDCSYVEIEAFGKATDDVEYVIANNLLGLNMAAESPQLPGVLDRLAADGLENREAIAVLQADLQANAHRLEGRAMRVVVKGVEVWRK